MRFQFNQYPCSHYVFHINQLFTANFRLFSGTCYIGRLILMFVAPDPQLSDPVVAPALDRAPGGNRARVGRPRGYGDGGEACKRMYDEGWCVSCGRCVHPGEAGT